MATFRTKIRWSLGYSMRILSELINGVSRDTCQNNIQLSKYRPILVPVYVWRLSVWSPFLDWTKASFL